ncbi:MAG: hypothetical protein QOG09_492, partial [Solirubrobacterales bacterium]|nr:hypothetical protein [Solirubrobacterales bacterium]
MDGTKRLRSQRLAVALIGGAMLLGGVGIGRAAWAQAPQPGDVGDPSGQVPQDPGEDCTQASADTGLSSATGGSGCDTQFTPIAKDGSKLGWTQIAGAVHGEATSPDGHASRDAYTNTIQSQKAPIPATVDFYTVSFLNPSFGLAGGAQCRREPPDGTGGEALTQFLDECERVPVIYRYTDNTENGPFWEEAYRGDEPGFVGAISWLHNLDTKEHGQRALAVGGTGSPSATCPKTQPGCPGYPRREPGMSDDPANADDSNCAEEGAKNAKVLEVDPEGDSPKGATWGPGGPLDAPRVDTNQTIAKQGDPQEALAECEDNWRKTHDPAGKGRAWLLTDSQWQELDAPSDMRGQSALDAALDVGNCQGATAECAFAGGLQQIWMWKDGGFDRLPWRPDGPSRPLFGPPNFNTPCTSSISCEWHFRVRAIRFKPGNAGGATAITSGCCSLNPDTNTGRTLSFERNTGLWRVQGRKALGVVGNTTSCFVPHCGPQRLPDSLYAMTESGGSMLASPGGPERPDEPPSQISGGSSSAMAGDSVPYDATRHYLSSARLVAGAADFRQHQQTPVDRAGGKATLTTIDSGSNDALMDWAVGGFKGTDRAAGYTTTTQAYGAGRAAPFPVDCPEGTLNGTESNPNTASGCKPNDKAAEQTKSGYLFSLSSYFLNGLAMAGDTGIGWGVGDRGAIERLAGNSAAAGGTLRPEGRPKLGPRQLGGVPPREPYTEAERDSAAEPGTVPALNGQPSERLPNPRLIPYGSPNPHSGQMGDETVKQIAMSRDGAEGWAIGPKVDTPNQTTTLYRFDGARWRRCGTDEVEGVLDADPACKALWPLRHHQNGVRLTAIARVPMEYGSDPTHA